MGGTQVWREVDGERIYGVKWSGTRVRDGDGFRSADLVAYADGVVDCEGSTTFAEFAARARAGDILAASPGGERMKSVRDFVGEVRDDIERLNDRPSLEERCLNAAEAFALEPTEGNRALLRAVYDEVPRRDAVYAFAGRMFYNRDIIRILVAGPGNPAETFAGTDVVNEPVQYYARRALIENRASERIAKKLPPDGLFQLGEPTVVVPLESLVDGQVVRAHEGVKPPHILVLRNEYPALIEVAGRTCVVSQAYLALSVADPDLRAALLDRTEPHLAAAAAQASRRENWALTRTAVMAELLRKKFDAHPDIAAVLMATGDTRLIYEGVSRSWSQERRRGWNWMGRLLEQIRSERAAAASVLGEL